MLIFFSTHIFLGWSSKIERNIIIKFKKHCWQQDSNPGPLDHGVTMFTTRETSSNRIGLKTESALGGEIESLENRISDFGVIFAQETF